MHVLITLYGFTIEDVDKLERMVQDAIVHRIENLRGKMLKKLVVVVVDEDSASRQEFDNVLEALHSIGASSVLVTQAKLLPLPWSYEVRKSAA